MTCAYWLRAASRMWGPIVVALGLLLLGLPSGAAAQRSPADPPPDPAVACSYGPTRRGGQVRADEIREASALVASRRWPGVYWTLNDSGNEPTLFAVGEDGQLRGTFRVPNATNVDWEALQLGPDGAGGYALYIGDIGDNDGKRSELQIYRIPEPEPGAGGTAPAAAFRFVYPDGPHNAEAMLVDPTTGEILVISRGLTGLSLVYRLPPLDGTAVMRPELVRVIDVNMFDPFTGPSSALVTDASVSMDGRRVVLRTYAVILLYTVPEGVGLSDIWRQDPTVSRLDDGPSGEGITFRADGLGLVSIGEGASPFLFHTDWQCPGL